MSDSTDPGHREHYWSMEHYGFDEPGPTASPETESAAISPSPTRSSRRGRALVAAAAVALLLSGTVGFVAAQASADQPTQNDVGGVVQVDGGAVTGQGDGRGTADGRSGPREGGRGGDR